MTIAANDTIDLWNADRRVHLMLRIAGYEFPEIKEENWLDVHLTLEHDGKHFERIDPSLEVRELGWLRDWLTALRCRRLPEWATLHFTEPCLAFHYWSSTPHSIRIGIELQLELKPKFTLHQLGLDCDDWRIAFDLSDAQLDAMIATLERTLQEYPERNPNA
jgi:hypothetical protein